MIPVAAHISNIRKRRPTSLRHSLKLKNQNSERSGSCWSVFRPFNRLSLAARKATHFEWNETIWACMLAKRASKEVISSLRWICLPFNLENLALWWARRSQIDCSKPRDGDGTPTKVGYIGMIADNVGVRAPSTEETRKGTAGEVSKETLEVNTDKISERKAAKVRKTLCWK